MTGKMQQARTLGTKLVPGLAVLCSGSGQPKSSMMLLLLQMGQSPALQNQMVGDVKGGGCFGGQSEAVQCSYTSCTSLTLLPFFPGSLLQTPLPSLYRYCINIKEKVAHCSKLGFLKHFHD